MGNESRDYSQAIRDSEQYVSEAEREGNPVWLAQALDSLAYVYILAHIFDRATECCQRVLDIAQQLGDEEMRITTMTYIARIYNGQGSSQQALAIAERALADSKRLGYSSGAGAAQLEIFSAYINMGQIERGLQVVDKLLANSKQIFDEHLEGARREMEGKYEFLHSLPDRQNDEATPK